jgi:alpha-beta hydrolase superfamily lysophospholipase
VRRWNEYLDDLHAFLAEISRVREAGDGAANPAPLFLLGQSHGALVIAAAGGAARR